MYVFRDISQLQGAFFHYFLAYFTRKQAAGNSGKAQERKSGKAKKEGRRGKNCCHIKMHIKIINPKTLTTSRGGGDTKPWQGFRGSQPASQAIVLMASCHASAALIAGPYPLSLRSCVYFGITVNSIILPT